MTFDPTFLYETYPRIEAEFAAELDQSLDPRGPDVMMRVVSELGLRPDSVAVDVGCKDGSHAFRLATHHGLRVLGLDPVQRHLDLARQARRSQPDVIARKVSFERGTATGIPLGDGQVDVVWSLDVLGHVPDVAAAFAEFNRVLRPGGHVVAHQVLAAPSFSGADAEWLTTMRGMVAASLAPATHDAAIAASGLAVVESIDLGGEWGEYAEERDGEVSRAMLRVARMRREPDRLRARFGSQAFDTMLATSLWSVHRLLGDLPGRLDVLVKP